MKYILLVMYAMGLLVTTNLYANEEPEKITHQHEMIAREVGNDLEMGGYRMKLRTNNSLDALIRVGVGELKRKGHHTEATRIENEWNTQWSFYMLRYDDLGDHAPLSEWLDKVYKALEAKLGVAVMEFTHLVDIKVLNYSIPVVFHPCAFDMGAIVIPRAEEYACHFVAYGPKKNGAFAPVCAYWAAYAACVMGSSGLGFSFACGELAVGAKWVMKKYIAPPLSAHISAKCKE